MRKNPWSAAAIVASALALATSANAQSPPHRVRGTIEQVTASAITIRGADGKDQSVKLTPGTRVVSDRALSLADIKAGDFIGTAAKKQADGHLVAIEVTVFPESLRGTGEGQRPWDEGPQSSMTNANVDEVVTSTSGRTLKLSYKGGSADVDVPPEAPIVTPVPGDRSLLLPGKAIVASLRPQSDGTLAAAFLTVEKDGVKPP